MLLDLLVDIPDCVTAGFVGRMLIAAAIVEDCFVFYFG